MKKKPLASASSLLERLFKKPKSPLSEGYFLCQLNQVWEELAGEEISKNSQPISFKNNLLTLTALSSSHVHEMQFVKETLRKKINDYFPDKRVRKIFFQVKDQQSYRWKPLKDML